MSIDIPEGHELAAAFGDTRFRSYHCGFQPDSYFPTMAFVRYKPINRQSFDKPVKVLDRGHRWILYDTPDREVLFTREGLSLGGDRPLNDHGDPWHHAVSFSINAKAGDDLPYDRYMINPHAITDRTASRMRKPSTIVKSDKIVMSDCLAWDTLIPTDKGVYPIGYIVGPNSEVEKREYKGNLKVLDLGGNPTKITHVFSSNDSRDIYQLVTKQGFVIEGSANHLVKTKNRQGEYNWEKLSEITIGNSVSLSFGLNCWSKTNVKVLGNSKGSYVANEITPDLSLLMGLLAAGMPRHKYEGENCIMTYNSSEATSLVASLCNTLFNIKCNVSDNKITIPSASSMFVFLNNFGSGIYNTRKVQRIRAPWAVVQSTKECVVQYIRGWFLASARVRGNEISILVKNDSLAQNIGSILLYLGVPNLIIVSNKVPFSCNIVVRDKVAIENLTRLFDLSYVEDYDNLLKSEHDSVNTHFTDKESGIIETSVVSCQVIRQDPVYDITLESEDHAYLAGPAIHTHNSGGFQLGHGGTSFINPITLSKFYRDNVDEGVILDIPARQVGDDPEIMHHTAKVHRLNAKLMTKHLPKGFRLANVVHGRNMQLLDNYRAETEYSADYNICCIAGMLRYNVLEAVYRVMYIIANGRKYKQYHLLGVSNPPLLAAMIRLAYMYKKSGEHILMTNDSSSPIGFALKRTYYAQPSHYEGLTPTRYGMRMSSSHDTPAGHLDNPHRRFAVGDPISSLLGSYLDFLHVDNNIMSRTYAIYQNQLELTRYVNQTCWYAENLDDKQYRELAQSQYKGSIHGHLLLTSLDFMVCAFEQGLEVAFNKFKSYMPNFTGDQGFRKFPSLFEGSAETEEDDASLKMNKKRLMKVIRGYYSYHKTGVEPERIRDESAKSKNLVVKI